MAEKNIYGIDYLTKQLGSKASLIRIRLRKKKVPKSGRSYIWGSKAEADKIVSMLKVKKAAPEQKKAA